MIEALNNWLSLFAPWPVVYLPFIFILGLMIGSFLNVVIFRTPKIMEQEFRSECCELLEINDKKQDKQQSGASFTSLSKPNSTCPQCSKPIKPWQNIPIISYLFLKGQCANCQNPISIRYPIIEFITAMLSVATVYLLGLSAATIFSLLLLWFLIALTMIDIDTFLLPDSLTLPLLWLGLLLNTFAVYTDLSSAVWGAIAGYGILWAVFYLFKIVTGKEGMGFGDFKLLAALGAWMGWQVLPVIIILSSFVGAVIGIAGILILGRDKNIPIPFGPYLAIAGWIAFLWGEQITQFYFATMGL